MAFSNQVSTPSVLKVYANRVSLWQSAVQGGLLSSLRAEVMREWPGARVNAVAPGPVDTARWEEECKQNPDQYYLAAQATASTGI